MQIAANLDLDSKIPLIAHNQNSGPVVKAFIQESPGKSVTGNRGWLTLREFVGAFSKVTGYQTELDQLPLGQFTFDCPPELKLEVQENHAFANEIGLHGGENSGAIHPKDVSFMPSLLLC